ncbi:MAG: NUDIX domain-containing protein, partial [Myxococcales bacterium]|nr:NUDIX domain-containing protein [Myxococcales bacterium]
MNDDPSAPPPSGSAAPHGRGASGSEPATIRHAATVVVLRPSAAGREVYMVRRSAKSPFMPSTLVFPGGRLDPEDGAPEADPTWERAARRESHEEARLRLDDHPLRWFDTWLTPSAESKRRYLARFYLVQLEAGEGAEARADGVETHEGR